MIPKGETEPSGSGGPRGFDGPTKDGAIFRSAPPLSAAAVVRSRQSFPDQYLCNVTAIDQYSGEYSTIPIMASTWDDFDRAGTIKQSNQPIPGAKGCARLGLTTAVHLRRIQAENANTLT